MTKYLTINKLTEILSRCYEAKTAYPGVQSQWNENNKTLGQCAVTALIVQYYFGGEIYKHNKYPHYFNVINNQVVDLTSSQFDFEFDYSDSIPKQPDLQKADTANRYQLLLNKVKKIIK